jgi:hypothetical protein
MIADVCPKVAVRYALRGVTTLPDPIAIRDCAHDDDGNDELLTRRARKAIGAAGAGEGIRSP